MRRRTPGFTLVEMIGVLAIMAIIASFTVPNIIRQFQVAESTGEEAKLEEIAGALQAGIEATGLIPNPNVFPTNTNNPNASTLEKGFGWAYLASNHTRLTGSNLISVFPGYTNKETYRRMFLSTNLAAAALKVDANTTFANISTNITNWGGTLFPTNPKIFLVSASRPDIRFTTIGGTNTDDFGCGFNGSSPLLQVAGTLWNRGVITNLEGWVKKFSDGFCEAPTHVVEATYTNKGEFIHVKTVDLSDFFNKAREAQEKAIAQEDKNLEEIARALVAAIQATGQLPNPNLPPFDITGPFDEPGWADLALPYTTLTPDAGSPNGRGTLHYAFPNDQRGSQTARRVYLDPLLMKYIAGNLLLFPTVFLTPGAGWDPMVDSDGILPVDMETGAMRMYIVSSSKPDLELAAPANDSVPALQPQPSGGNYNPNLITALLNWQKTRTPLSDPMPGVIPVPNVIAQWGAAYPALANYSTRGEFLHVKVVDLRPLFCRVSLVEYPIPQAQASERGTGYSPASSKFYGSISAGFTYEFSSDGSAEIPDGTSGSFFSGIKTMIKRTGGPFSLNGTITGGSSATFTATLNNTIPYPPWWEISPPTSSFVPQQMPTTGNTSFFYVIKGTTLMLFGNSNSAPSFGTSPILSVQINNDSTFEYFNGSWTRIN